MVLFGNRNEREIAQINNEIEPYRAMSAATEVEERITELNQDLMFNNKHLLTSNDRFQTTAAFLTLARNRYLITEAVAGAITKDPGGDFKASQYNPATITNFLVTGYQSTKENLEAADEVAHQKGFTLGQRHARALTDLTGTFDWPPATVVSRNFIEGTVIGAGDVLAYVSQQYTEILNSSLVPNNFKVKLKNHVERLFAELETKTKAIERTTGGFIGSVNSEAALSDIYKDAVRSFSILDELTLWVSVPKLKDPSFELREPLDEINGPKKAFNPGTLGEPVTRQVIDTQQPEAKPKPSGKPFSLGSLGVGVPSTQDQSSNTDTSPRSSRQPSRPFSADSLTQTSMRTLRDVRRVNNSRPFDSSTLASATDKGAPRRENTFDPSVLNSPQRPPRQKSFDPSSLDT